LQNLFDPEDDAVPPSPLSGGPDPMPDPRRLDSRDLLAGRPEVEIQHGTQVYRLRLTALGKLILTK